MWTDGSVTVKVDVVDILESFGTEALAAVILAVCEHRMDLQQRLLDAWGGGRSRDEPHVRGGGAAWKVALEQPSRSASPSFDARRGAQPIRNRAVAEVRPLMAKEPRAKARGATTREVAAASRLDVEAGEKLWRAVHSDDVREVVQLLGRGAPQSFRGPDGCCPAGTAVRKSCQSRILDELLNARADVHQTSVAGLGLVHLWCMQTLSDLDQSDFSAAREKLRALVLAQADLQQVVPSTYDTPLHLVARDYEHYLRGLSGGPVSSRNDEKAHTGTHRQHSFKFQLLLEARADPDQLNGADKTALNLVRPEARASLVASRQDVA